MQEGELEGLSKPQLISKLLEMRDKVEEHRQFKQEGEWSMQTAISRSWLKLESLTTSPLPSCSAAEMQRNILRCTGQAVICTDLFGTIIYWNSGATRMYGWLEEEAVGQDIFARLPAASPMLEEEGVAIFAELSRGMQYEGQYAMIAKGGSVVEVVVTNTPIMDEAGCLVGIIGCSTDVGELKKKEAEILRLNSELEQRVAERTKQLVAEIQEHLVAKENLQAYARVRPPPLDQG